MKGGGIHGGSSVYFVIFIILKTSADSGLITEQSVTECKCPDNRCPHRPEEGVCGHVVLGDSTSRMILTLSEKDLDHSRQSTVCVEKCCDGFEQISTKPLACILKAGPEVAKHRRYSSCNNNERRNQCASCNHGTCDNDVCICQDGWSGHCCDEGPSSRPHSVVIVSVRADSVTVMWEPPANGGSVAATSYSVIVTTQSDESEVLKVVRGATVANITELDPYTKYRLRISTWNSFGTASFSDSVTFCTGESYPSKPQNLTVTSKTSRSLTVEWSPPLTPNGVILNYQVSYVGLESVNPVPDSFETVETLNLSGTTYTVDVAGLSPHSLYNISVKAFTSVGGGEESTVTIRTEEDAPSAPSNLTLTRVTTNNITVEWSQPVYPNGIVDSFVIVITDDVSHAEVDQVMTSGNASNHLVTFSGLLSVWPYTIHVAAYTNSLGNSSTITATTYGVSPVIEPVNGTTEQFVKNGHPVILEFVILEADPPVPAANITWYFTSISSRTILPCTNNYTKYNFSSNCLTLAIGNVNASDGGLYEVLVSTRAGEDSSRIAVTISEVPPQFLSLLENRTVQVSTNHTFVCAASGDPRLVFTWRFNGEKIDNTGPKYSIASNITVSVLVISDVTGLDEGVYNCSVSNRFGQEATSAYLTVQVPPVITADPSSTRDVVAGEVLNVTCAAVGEPAPRILWYHRGLILNTNMSNSAALLTSEITAKTTTSSLKVLNVSTEDDGPYSCVAVNFLGNDSRDLAVTVVVRPVITGITVQSNSCNISNLTHGGVLTMEEFTPVDLTCNASGLPAPVIIWLKNGAVLTNSSSRVIESTIGNTTEGVDGTFESTATLRFNSLQLSDSSTYTCRAVSYKESPIPGEPSWTFEINVTARNECMALPPPCLNDGVCIDGVGQPVCRCAIVEFGAFYGKHCERMSDKATPPSITEEPKDTYVNVGSRVTLQCKARGIPDPVVTWFKDREALGGPQAVGESYTIMEMTPEQRGIYHCQAENDKGTINSDIARVLILGLAQVRVGLGEEGQRRNKRKSVPNKEVIELLELLAVNKVLRTDNGMKLTIYSIKPAADNLDEMIVTLLADNNTASGTDIANAALGPLRMLFGEYSDIFPTISFDIRGSERFDGCPAVEDQTCSNVANITWPQTEIGETATVMCPCGVDDELINRLQATRVCGGTYTSGAKWKDPICEECKFSETRRELCSLGLIENSVNLARALDDVAKNTSEFLKEDVSLSTTLLGRVAADRKALREKAVQSDVLSFVSSVNSITPKVLKASQSITGSSSKVLNVIDDVAENTDTSNGSFLYSSSQFGLLIAPAEALSNTSYPLNITSLLKQVANKTSSTNVSTSDSVQIPGSLSKKNYRVSTTIFTNHALFQSRDQYISKTGEQFTQVGSSVLSVSILGETVSGLDDDDRVQFVFSKTQKTHDRTSCQFWDVSLDESFGSWDDSGCELVSETDTTVVCKCNHLTHFALLMDISPGSSIHPPTVNDVILTWVSYIGAGICIVCLVVTIIANLAMKSLRNALYTKLLIHLCTALIGLYSAFIVGTFAMPVPVLCGIISALMHYFFLATFLWMASLAIFIFRSIVQPFELPFRNHYEISGAICWVLPVFIVAFSLAPRHQNYYHKEFCRVQGYSFWIGVLVPFGVIYIFNWIIFIIITITLVRRPNMKKEAGKKDNQWKENLAVSAILSVLFGLGWASGFFASTDVKVDFIRVPFEWIFTILNCSQGVLIFYVYCLRQPEVRKNLKRMISLCNYGERADSTKGHSTSTGSKLFDPALKKANGSENNVPKTPQEQFSFPQNDNSYSEETQPRNPVELPNDVQNCTLSGTQEQIRSSAFKVASSVHLDDLNNGSNNALGIVEQANGNKHTEITSVM